MTTTSQIISACTICLIIFATSCTKNTALLTPSSSSTIEERVGTSTKFMNVLMYSKAAYDQHDAHSYAEGHILEFRNADWQSLESANATKMQSALAFMKHAILTGDTTGQSQNLFTYIIIDASYMDTYPDSALIYGPNFNAFKTWFQSVCTNWMTANHCNNIAVNYNTSQYLMKVHCAGN